MPTHKSVNLYIIILINHIITLFTMFFNNEIITLKFVENDETI